MPMRVLTQERRKPAQAPALPLTGVEAAIASLRLSAHTPEGMTLAPGQIRPWQCTLGSEQGPLSGVAPTSLAPAHSVTKAHTAGKKWNQYRSSGPSPQGPSTLQTKGESITTLRKNPTPSGLLLQPFGPRLNPKRAVKVMGHRRGPDLT